MPRTTRFIMMFSYTLISCQHFYPPSGPLTDYTLYHTICLKGYCSTHYSEYVWSITIFADAGGLLSLWYPFWVMWIKLLIFLYYIRLVISVVIHLPPMEKMIFSCRSLSLILVPKTKCHEVEDCWMQWQKLHLHCKNEVFKKCLIDKCLFATSY